MHTFPRRTFAFVLAAELRRNRIYLPSHRLPERLSVMISDVILRPVAMILQRSPEDALARRGLEAK